MPQATLLFNDGATTFIDVRPQETLLDAAFRHGIPLPADCREGVCGTCRGLCEAGKIHMDYADEEAVPEAERAAGIMLACQTRLDSDARFRFDVDRSRCKVNALRLNATVVDARAVSAAATLLTLALPETMDFGKVAWLPGQYARLHVPGSSAVRAYSFLRSRLRGNTLEFLIRLLPEGAMSDYLRGRCRPGDVIALELPFGAFYLRQADRPLVLLAGGTGLSAILSMLETLASNATPHVLPIHVIYGVQTPADISLLHELQGYAAVFPHFQLDIVVTRAESGWTGKTGYVTTALQKETLQQPFDAYLCGPPPMIAAVQQWFLEANGEIAEHRIYFEKFVAS
ncbi:MAG: 2Fe-2S iron-sulfur cluster binding domain-containing protein [Zoogloeaceae bacterium]|jgi:anthranilate 1,2-dioxygenase reductase subunit|nr:2Fe-2S iron-sulfur cluster binding domain-containing protein [Zoogloeaceae bacterium]